MAEGEAPAPAPPAPERSRRVAVTGAAGFIGHHLERHLRRLGCWVRGVDLLDPQYAPSAAHEHRIADLRHPDRALAALEGVDEVYALAADMGGMGYISRFHARILHDNLLIDAHTLEAARRQGVRRLLYASSACVYPEGRQAEEEAPPLTEDEAYPAQPQDAYGWAKLTGERLCLHYRLDHGLETRVARLHNVYGPEGAWDGGREKAPAALCRKVALARLRGEEEIEVWGDGRQVRTFCYIDDCVEGLHRLMRSPCAEPVNLGSTRRVAIDELARLVAGVAGVSIRLRHAPGPQGVRARSPDNTRLREVLGWEPSTPLETGLATTYRWVEEQVRRRESASAAAAP
jgi:nucleoside-diphosphate-sugar epimerase